MRVKMQSLNPEELADPDSPRWSRVEETAITLSPSPVQLVRAVSPYMSRTIGHGKVDEIKVKACHNGTTFSIWLSWVDPEQDDGLSDLDRFPDAAAVMFPLQAGASAITMGEPGKEVNGWFWRADEAQPFDVIAAGYATSQRRKALESGLSSQVSYSSGRWRLVFQRPLVAMKSDLVALANGTETGIAFAVWEGSNSERAGQKAVSGEFSKLLIDG